MTAIAATLPWPPSVNSVWKRGTKFGGRKNMRLSDRARAYRMEAWAALVGARASGKCLTGRLSLSVALFPPDRRRRDIDNGMKALLDALVHARVIEDDGLICRLLIERREIVKGGRVDIVIGRVG